MAESPTFEPRDGSPTIHVNIRTHTNDSTVQKMYREHTVETAKAEAQNSNVGTTKYDVASTTTYEYDVVACADYVEDKGCWVRNMPEEIKRANPNFVPT